MTAEYDPEQETTPGLPRYDRQNEFQQIFNEALAFENRLNAHVDPWISLCGRLVRSRLYLGLAAFVVTLALAVTLFIEAGLFWGALGIVASPILFAVWTWIFQGLATTCGCGVQGSEGLPHTRSELKAVLDRERACLEHAQEVNEKGLSQYSNRSAVKALTDLCNIRVKGLFVHQRVLRRINVLTETCDIMLASVRIIALVVPLVLVALAAALLTFPFIYAESIAPWATSELLTAAAVFTAFALAAFLLPFVLSYSYMRMIQRKLTDTLQSNWNVEPSAFDSTGPVAEQFEWILSEWEECKRIRQQVNLQMKSLAQRLQRRNASLPAFPKAPKPSGGGLH